MDDDELQKLRGFCWCRRQVSTLKVKAFVKKIADRLGRKPKEDDFKRFEPKRRKKAS